jgi:hypothetical protein
MSQDLDLGMDFAGGFERSLSCADEIILRVGILSLGIFADSREVSW